MTLTDDATLPFRDATRFVLRPRLSALLDAKPWARLAVVSAPAGFGKTAAVSAWATSGDVRAAAVGIQSADNDPVRFARLVARALAALSDPGQADGEIGYDDETVGTAILEWFRLAAASAGGRRVALVLDDFHLIEERRIHRLVADVVERLPERSIVVVATRADPPIPLSRLRARDELVEVRADDLRFTPDEAAALLLTSGVELEPDDLAALTARTEGWAAVLRLAAIALRGRDDVAEAVRRFGASHRFVLDYVVEEVLAGLPAEAVDFLLRTSILERLSGDLCDAVTERRDGKAMLERLDRDNILLVPLDEERAWFRYHALFSEILRGRLRAELGPDSRALDDRASRWFESQGRDDEAITHAIAARDLDRAGQLVADASLRCLNAGEIVTVRGWLDALGPDVVRSVAQLSLSYAWCLALGGQLDQADERIREADAAHVAELDGGELGVGVIPAELALIRSYIAGVRGDGATAASQAADVRRLVPAGLPPVFEATLRGDATLFLARALLVAGNYTGGFSTAVAALPDLRAGRNVLALGRTMNDLAIASIKHGDPGAALRLCEQELKLTAAIASSPPYWGALARIREALGDTTAARVAAERALELALRSGDGRVASWARETQERLAENAEGAGSAPKSPNEALVEPLTNRELEVLLLVAEGRSNKQTAEQLFVTVGTVKSHIHAISGKLGAANRVEAVAFARRLRLLD